MSLEKSILSGKEHRNKEYLKRKSCSPECRNHGTCEWCKGNRLHKFKKSEPIVEEDK